MEIKTFDRRRNCRVCLLDTADVILLFDSANEFYKETLIKCSNVRVEENDGLPFVMCESCGKKLLEVNSFIDKCQETDKFLRLYLKEKAVNSCKVEINGIKVEPGDSLEEYVLEDYNLSDDSKSDVLINSKEKKRRHKKKKRKIHSGLTKRSGDINKPHLNCEQCGLSVRSRSAMIIHVATHSQERPFQCADCGKSYRSRGNLTKHTVTSHGREEDRKYKCDECQRGFHCRSELVVHSRTHTGDTPYKCEWCPKSFAQLSALTRHRLTHTGERPFQCAVCGKKFSTRDNLKNHMLVHSTEKKFSCKICGILLKSKGSLGKHQLLHSNLKAFVCDQCGSSFRTKGNLKLHMDKKHSDKSGFCSICAKRYSNIEEHNNIHSGKTPFQCAMCNKRYGVKRSLLVHMRKHDNQEKYSCHYDGCSKKFPIKCMLDFHVLKYHKKQTPYVCGLCKRGFFRLNDLNLHKKMNHLCMMVRKGTETGQPENSETQPV